MNPAISIILPAYSAEKYLEKAVESILGQTFQDFELLIIDDGSQDRTGEICTRFTDKRVRFYARQHSGLVSTLNFAVAQSSAAWIARMDADDISLPHRLEHQLKYVRSHVNIKVLGGSARLIDQAGNDSGRPITPPSEHLAIMRMLTGRRRGPGLIHPSVLICKDTLLKAGGYREEFPNCEDLDLWLRISQFGELHSLPESVLLLRKHADNISKVNCDLALKSKLAARICHELRCRTNIDIVEERPEVWAKCSREIGAAIAAKGLAELALLRRKKVNSFRHNFLRGSLLILIQALAHPGRFWRTFSYVTERRIINRIAALLLPQITTSP